MAEDISKRLDRPMYDPENPTAIAHYPTSPGSIMADQLKANDLVKEL
jgi:hypothetical protein